MNNQIIAEKIAEDLKIIAEPNRLKILKLLLKQDFLCVNAITHRLSISQSAVSQHLRVLRQAGYVNREKRANRIHYSLNKARIDELVIAFCDIWKA
jgi:ArsR family transcriptional regulator, arsenate/arsenite/antimonite-responsive transcriptional repressor